MVGLELFFEYSYIQEYQQQAMSYYDFHNLNVLFPYIWVYTQQKFLRKENITLEQVKELDDMIMVMDVKSADDIKNLPKKEQELYSKLKQLYERGKSHYQNSAAQTPYYDPNSMYYQNYYAQQPYYDQNGNIYYQNAGYAYQYQANSNQQYYPQQYNQQYNTQGQQNSGNYYQKNQNQYYQNQNQNYQNQNYYNNQYYQNQTQTYQNQGYQNYQNQGYQYDQYNQKASEPYQQTQTQNQRYVEKTEPEIQTVQQSVPQIQQKIEEKTAQFNVSVQSQPVVLEKKKLSIDQIRNMIAGAANKEQLKKSINPQLISQIQETKKWNKKVEQVVASSQNQGDRDNKGKKPHNKQFQKGKNFEANTKQYERKNYGKPPVPVAPIFDIKIGKNEDLQTRMVKDKLKEQAAGGDYAQMKQDELKNLDKISKSKRQILYKLNQVAPENVKEIANDIQEFAVKDQDICILLAEQIIKKAWEQPKYAASYAKLSQYLVRIVPQKFQFQKEKDTKKNPFKHILIQKVQHSFDKKQKKMIPQNEEDKEKFARQNKNLIIGNVKFISELIKIKLIPKKIIKVCITQLIMSFLEGYYLVNKEQKLEYTYFQFYFEALIEFLQNLGEKYQQIAQPKTKQEEEVAKAKNLQIQQQIKQYSQLKKHYADIGGLQDQRADEYFTIINLLNSIVLPKLKDGRRLSALLQNLVERRGNNWKKHNVQSEGPKKLKDLKYDDEASTQQKLKVDLNLLDDKMSKLLKKWVEGDNKVAFDQIQSLGKKYASQELIGSYLRNVSEDKKQSVLKRLELFNMLTDKYLDMGKWKNIWTAAIQHLATLQSQFPFCAAVLAKILITLNEKKEINYIDYFIKFDEDQEEDQFYFMDNIFQKLYHYSQDDKVKQVIEPKAKLTHLL